MILCLMFLLCKSVNSAKEQKQMRRDRLFWMHSLLIPSLALLFRVKDLARCVTLTEGSVIEKTNRCLQTNALPHMHCNSSLLNTVQSCTIYLSDSRDGYGEGPLFNSSICYPHRRSWLQPMASQVKWIKISAWRLWKGSTRIDNTRQDGPIIWLSMGEPQFYNNIISTEFVATIWKNIYILDYSFWTLHMSMATGDSGS